MKIIRPMGNDLMWNDFKNKSYLTQKDNHFAKQIDDIMNKYMYICPELKNI